MEDPRLFLPLPFMRLDHGLWEIHANGEPITPYMKSLLLQITDVTPRPAGGHKTNSKL